MKKGIGKKILAATLSAALAFQATILLEPVAATAQVALKASSKTLKIGEVYKLKLKNNTLNWKITKVSANHTDICKVSNKTSYVKLKGKAAGKTTVRVTVRTAKKAAGTANKKQLTCKVKVVAQDVGIQSIEPQLSVKSDILGLVDTGNKTTLKVDLIKTSGPGDTNIYHYDENGKRVIYENQEEQCVRMEPVAYTGSAVLDLGPDVDDSLLDSSKAVVKLLDGNGYYADEMVLKADSLNGVWSNGKYVYTLDTGDLEWNTWGYDTSVDYNSNREWSIMGGDGNGVYYFRLEASGITYDGKEVPAAIIPVAVYTYGRTCTDLSLSTEFVENTYDSSYVSCTAPTDEVQWGWHTENKDAVSDGKPYMNDTYTDYFSVIWPKGTDASEITADDVKVTLHSKYGDSYTLSTQNAYGEREYAVFSNGGETGIAVTYQQWSFIPVYSTMEISIQKGGLSASKTYDICSVAAYMVQTGGGGVTVDHTVTCWNYYGVLGMTLENAANTRYTLSTEKDGVTYYYAEDENGKAYLSKGVESEGMMGRVMVSAPQDAWTGDATEKYNIAVHGNVLFAETRLDTAEEKVVDGVTYTFQQNVSARKEIPQMLALGARLDDGYNLSGCGPLQWAWTKRYQSGWTVGTPKPTSLPYVDGNYGYGYAAGSSNPIYDAELAQSPAPVKK